MLASWRDLFAHLVLPRACAACREDLAPVLRGPLCGPCMERLGALRAREGARGARTLPGIDALASAFPYEGPVRALVLAWKLHGSPSAGAALAGWTAGIWARLPELRPPFVVVPVPLHPRRLRERGFNQAEVLGRALARQAEMPLVDGLRRVGSSVPQRRLGRRARADNACDAYRVEPGTDLFGAPVLLVDDVCTTGSTLRACARALLESGAGSVRAFTAARD